MTTIKIEKYGKYSYGINQLRNDFEKIINNDINKIVSNTHIVSILLDSYGVNIGDHGLSKEPFKVSKIKGIDVYIDSLLPWDDNIIRLYKDNDVINEIIIIDDFDILI